MTETDQLQLIKDDSLSVNDLVGLQEAGFSVLRSAHVGNLTPYNLTLAEAGIPILSVDHTITGVDRNYLPEQVVTQEGASLLAPSDKLVCRVLLGTGTYLDELHTGAAREAVPGANIFTNTEYLRANESVAGEIVMLTAQEFPEYFNRLALPDGSTAYVDDAARYLGTLGIMQLNDEPRAEREAIIMPNIIDIVTNFVVEYLRTEQPVQYHLSGPDMIKYIDQLMPDVQQLYGRIKEATSFGTQLPPQLLVYLVPTAKAKFATTAARQPLLDELLGVMEVVDASLAGLRTERKAFFASEAARDQSQRADFLTNVMQAEMDLNVELGERLAALPELLPEPPDPGAITQYDVLQEGGLYVAPINRELSMAELAEVSLRVNQLRKRFGP